MINDLSKNNELIIKKIENVLISDGHKVNVVEDFNNNPFIKYIVYSINEEPVGYLSYYDIYGRYEIVNVYVLNNNRNCGIGSELLNELINRGKKDKINNITLEVNENNVNAIKLYTKYGFNKKSIREKYYSDADGILMEKEMI